MKICSKILNFLEKVMKKNRGLAKNTSKKLKYRFLFNLNMFLNLIAKQKETTFFHLHCVNVNHYTYMQYKQIHIHLHLFITWVYRFIIHLHNGVYFFHHVKAMYI
jgi:hypothetical protein